MVFLIVDALDECTDRVKLLEQLHLLIKESSKFNIFVTSREEIDLETSLDHLPRLSLSENSEDINLYIDHRLGDLIALKEIRIRNPSLKSEIHDSISAKADGMYVLSCSESASILVLIVSSSNSSNVNSTLCAALQVTSGYERLYRNFQKA